MLCQLFSLCCNRCWLPLLAPATPLELTFSVPSISSSLDTLELDLQILVSYILIWKHIIHTNILQFFGSSGLCCWGVFTVFMGGYGARVRPFLTQKILNLLIRLVWGAVRLLLSPVLMPWPTLSIAGVAVLDCIESSNEAWVSITVSGGWVATICRDLHTHWVISKRSKGWTKMSEISCECGEKGQCLGWSLSSWYVLYLYIWCLTTLIDGTNSAVTRHSSPFPHHERTTC